MNLITSELLQYRLTLFLLDESPTIANPEDAVIYEGHIRGDPSEFKS